MELTAGKVITGALCQKKKKQTNKKKTKQKKNIWAQTKLTVSSENC